MTELDFHILNSDPCVFRRESVWILLYVDDIIMIGPREPEIEAVKKSLKARLDIKDIGNLSQFLGVRFIRDREGAWLSQSQYIATVLQKFGLSDCKSVATPMCISLGDSEHSESIDQTSYQEMIGTLLFLSTRTRPDISSTVGILSRFASDPRRIHEVAVKRVIRYLQGTRDFALWMGVGDEKLVAYTDADWAGDEADRKSTTGTLLKLGDCSVAWNSSKQNCVALSSTEAEFIAASETCVLVIWLRHLMNELSVGPSESTVLYEDNQGAIRLGTDGIRKAKHVSIRRNFVKEHVDSRLIALRYCPAERMVADVLTKPLNRVRFERLREAMGVLRWPSVEQDKKGC